MFTFNPQADSLAERLVNNLFLDNETQDLRHALRLKLLALQVTERFGKSQVLEWYLNSLYFGHNVYGIDNAARFYLGKSASDLTLPDSALLLAISESPALNPADAPAAALEQQKIMLARLVQSKIINPDEYNLALKTPPGLVKITDEEPQTELAFNNLVKQQLESYLSSQTLERGGYKIITTLDNDLQKQLTCTLHAQLLKLEGQPIASAETACDAALLLPTLPPLPEVLPPELQASALILDIKAGEVLALSGDMNSAGESPSMTARNPGTLLTPFVALAAFSKGYNPASLVWDIPNSLPEVVPAEFQDKLTFHGPLRLRAAISNDYLPPVLQLLNQLGANNVWQISAPLGLSLNSSGDNVALLYPYQGSQVTLLETARAYATIARLGLQTGQPDGNGSLTPNVILRIESWDGRLIVDRSQPQNNTIISAPLAYLTHHVLADEDARRVSLGYPNWLDIGRPSAAKIGQTFDQKDAWTVGYSPYRLVAVRVDLPDAKSSAHLDYHAAAGVWNALMQYTHQNLPADDWDQPAGISNVDVCDPSGLLPTRYCPSVVKEVFLSGNEPSGYDNLYRSFTINRETGRLATVFTPLDLVEDRTFLVPPAEARTWVANAGLSLPPDSYDNIQIAPPSADANISSPPLFAFIHGKVEISGSAGGKDFSAYHLQVGQGLNPSAWITLETNGNAPVANAILAEWNT
ncbi:MAG: transglycosylase domain-containing protein, partial [Anaerolineae bacterium]|nr:transglycosylase domain-containing protein [Anaerolineae bacterium]